MRRNADETRAESGAASATFVERDGRARAAIAENLRATGFEAKATVVADDALRALARWATAPPVDLALLDPPYDHDAWDEVLAALRARTVVIESDREVPLPGSWEVVRAKEYGSTLVVIARTPF